MLDVGEGSLPKTSFPAFSREPAVAGYGLERLTIDTSPGHSSQICILVGCGSYSHLFFLKYLGRSHQFPWRSASYRAKGLSYSIHSVSRR